MIKNLIFQGGSVKGVAYVGALEALEKQLGQEQMRQIKNVAGTSAGAITATLFALGCDTTQLKKLLLNFDFKALLDDPEKGFKTSDKVLKSIEKSEEGHNKFFSKLPAKTVKGPLISRVVNQFGIYSGEFFRKWAEQIISEQVKNLTNNKHTAENLTFNELHQLTEEYPQVFRDLYVVGVNVNTGKSMTFSYANPETKDVIIADAVRISMSIPLLFQPHCVYSKVSGERMVDAQKDLWVDGGLYDNYPIRCFDQVDNGKLIYNPETLGFRLVSKENKDFFEGLSDAPGSELSNIAVFIKALLNSSMSKQNDDHDATPADKQRTIYIDHLGISMLAFNLTSKQQEALIQSGQRAVELYFTGKTQIPPPTIVTSTEPDPIPEEKQQQCLIQ